MKNIGILKELKNRHDDLVELDLDITEHFEQLQTISAQLLSVLSNKDMSDEATVQIENLDISHLGKNLVIPTNLNCLNTEYLYIAADQLTKTNLETLKTCTSLKEVYVEKYKERDIPDILKEMIINDLRTFLESRKGTLSID